MAHHRDRHGLHPDVPDPRDHVYVPQAGRRLPVRVDLRPDCPPAYRQLRLNACSAHAIASAMWFDERKHGGRGAPSPSRLFIYYNERAHVGLAGSNAPVSLRDGYRAVAKFGACDERLWPYVPARFARRPAARCYREATGHVARSYHRIRQHLRPMKACLAEGYPITFGISVHASMMSGAVRATGRIPMPARGDRVVGGHALLAVGYDDRAGSLVVLNSWGTRWGLRGYGLLPYAFVEHPALAWDFWTCRRVEREPGRRARVT